VDPTAFFFLPKTLYHWTAAFSVFILLVLNVFLRIWVAPYHFLIKFDYLQKNSYDKRVMLIFRNSRFLPVDYQKEFHFFLLGLKYIWAPEI
jgi:hypothetical protein